MTARSRLLVAFAYVLLLAVVALSVPLGINAARNARDTFAVQLTNTAERIAEDVPRARERGGDALARVAGRAPEFGRIIVTDENATLIEDSLDYHPVGRDYRYRPEIPAALEGRITRLVREYPDSGLQYIVAVPVLDDGRIVGAVRINQRVATVDALVRQRLIYLAVGCLGVLMVAMVVALLLARSLTKPLRRLREVAGRIEGGDLGAQAPEAGPPEVAAVAAALNSMSRRIAHTVNAQTEFVANASHQLRTPLTGLRLRLEALDAAGAPGAPAALAETDRLSDLVTDLLTLMQAGTLPEAAARTDLCAAAEEAFDRWSVQAAETGHLVRLDCGTGDLHASAGSGDVAIVLDNLIENAIKYTPGGTTITIEVNAADDECVLLAVADDGPGMAVEDRERAFDRFYRGAAGSAVSGTGLGLAIVRQVVVRWGGTIEITGSGGTRFEVSLPRAAELSGDPDDTVPLQPVGSRAYS